MIFYTYIWTEGVRKFIIISLILNKFSCGKAQIHGGESSDILYVYLDRMGKKIDHYFFNT